MLVLTLVLGVVPVHFVSANIQVEKQAIDYILVDIPAVIGSNPLTLGQIGLYDQGDNATVQENQVLKSVVGKVTLTEEQLVLADTDGSGSADAVDALNILKKVVGKIQQFPVEQ